MAYAIDIYDVIGEGRCGGMVNREIRPIVNGIFESQKTARNSEFLPEIALWEPPGFAVNHVRINLGGRLYDANGTLTFGAIGFLLRIGRTAAKGQPLPAAARYH